MHNTIKNSLLAAILLSITGCASIFQGTDQFVMIKTVNDNDRTSTNCTINSGKNQVQTMSWTNVKVSRKNSAMNVTCENDSQIGSTSVDSAVQMKWVGLNALMDFCIISCIFDAATGALYEYPDGFQVVMKNKE